MPKTKAYEKFSAARKAALATLFRLQERKPFRRLTDGLYGRELSADYYGAFASVEIERLLKIDSRQCAERMQYLLEHGYVYTYPRQMEFVYVWAEDGKLSTGSIAERFRGRLQLLSFWHLTPLGEQLARTDEFQSLIFDQFLEPLADLVCYEQQPSQI